MARSWRSIAAVCAFVVLVTACSSTPDEDAGPTTTVFIPPTVFVVLTSPTTPVTSAFPLPLDEVESCVAQTMYYAFIGNEFWRQAWDDLGQDESLLRANCEDLAVTDPDILRRLHDDWLPVQAGLD